MKPNIIFIHVDQLNARAIRALGCRYVSTPNLDHLFENGTSFDISYSANPVCCPARTSWYTGRMSSEHGVIDNQFTLQRDPPDLGQWLSARGYDCCYTGKWHVPGRRVDQSFRFLYGGSGMGEYTDAAVARAAESFLITREGDTPFFLNVGFLNPHDICYWLFAKNPAKYEYAMFIRDALPPLPKSYDPSQSTGFNSEDEIRFYIYSYYRMVEMVDREIGRILTALSSSRFAKNTLVLFSADHGEMLVEHNQFTKGVLYEGSVRVPLAAYWPGVVKRGTIDRDHAVSGVDITATILDYAGAPLMPKMTFARSLRPFIEGRSADSWRGFIAAENYRHDLETMIRAGTMKSIHSPAGISLFDLAKDPDELRDVAADTTYAQTAAQHKKMYSEYRSIIDPIPEPADGWGKAAKKKGKDDYE
ncbi:MAG: sulfatase-like hydrolase/transferase [Spirochaetes bacterium]|nr:sulfatase-like hydrolase/transferase [Spirochaetota bacterium]